MFAIDRLERLARPVAALALGLAVLAIAACDDHGHSGHDHPKHGPGSHGHEAGSDPSAGKAQGDAYPLETCVVSGEKLGDHGKPYDHEHEGRLVRFCCEACIDDFNQDPAKYLAKIDRATAAKAAEEKK